MAQTMDKGQMKRRPVDPMRHHRENGWDYRGRAIYHFTLPVEERFPLFGTLADAPVHFARIFAGRGSIWEQDAAYYHERILHAPGQLRRMIDYVKDNPRRLWIKSHNPELFRLHRRTEVAGLSFTSMGNHFLLEWPDRQVVEMSRSYFVSEIKKNLFFFCISHDYS